MTRFSRHVLAAALLLTTTTPLAAAAPDDDSSSFPRVSFPNPCYDLPATRTAHDGTQDGDGGWQLVRFRDFHDHTDRHDAVYDEAHHNDDLSDLELLAFVFNFFGTQYDRLYINNNGNVSFDGPYSHYDPEGFPVSGFDMIAPVSWWLLL